MMTNTSQYELGDWKKCGILHCGYRGCYAAAEAFMRKIIELEFDDPSFTITMTLEGKDFNIDEACYGDFLDLKYHDDAIERIYSRCVETGDFFDSFVQVCAKTKLLDPWFLSENFMSNVHAGSIRGHWSIPMQGEESKEPYRSRFRRFIKSLDERGLEWTKKYLEPDSFWGQKKKYW
jgi:hypothetical protein